jgi:hypothetical protein
MTPEDQELFLTHMMNYLMDWQEMFDSGVLTPTEQKVFPTFMKLERELDELAGHFLRIMSPEAKQSYAKKLMYWASVDEENDQTMWAYRLLDLMPGLDYCLRHGVIRATQQKIRDDIFAPYRVGTLHQLAEKTGLPLRTLDLYWLRGFIKRADARARLLREVNQQRRSKGVELPELSELPQVPEEYRNDPGEDDEPEGQLAGEVQKDKLSEIP